MKFLLPFLLLSQAHSTWRDTSDFRRDSYVFSQFKYYSFYSEKLSGHLAYVQLSPDKLNRFYLIANIVSGEQQFTMLQPLPGSCVAKNPQNTEISACGNAGIFREDEKGLFIYNNSGFIRWQLYAEKSPQYNQLQQYNLNFYKNSFLENILGMLLDLNWSISWKPIDLAMKLSGAIQVNGKNFPVENQTSYHDDTWGNWNFFTQPYFWIYFDDPKAKESLQLVVGDIYFNKDDRFMGLKVLINHQEIIYRPDEYDIFISQLTPASSIPLYLFKNKETRFITNKKMIHKNPTHLYPQKVQIVTKDGKVNVEAKVAMLTPYLAKLPLRMQSAFGPVWNDDMVVDVNYEIRELNGHSFSGKTKGGMELFQTKKIGLRAFTAE